MKTLAIVAIFLVGIACSTSNSNEPSLESEAVLNNYLAVDGCDWNFRIDVKKDSVVTYAPSEATLQKVKTFATENGGFQYGVFSQKVKIKYQITNRKREVTCGWGKKPLMDEIEVTEMTKL